MCHPASVVQKQRTANGAGLSNTKPSLQVSTPQRVWNYPKQRCKRGGGYQTRGHRSLWGTLCVLTTVPVEPSCPSYFVSLFTRCLTTKWILQETSLVVKKEADIICLGEDGKALCSRFPVSMNLIRFSYAPSNPLLPLKSYPGLL